MQPVLQPLARVWNGLSRTQQIGLGAILAVGVGLLFFITTVGRTADLGIAFSGLSDQDRATAVAKLKESKIPYELGEGGIIRVPSAQVQEARLTMAGQGLDGAPTT